MTVRLQGERILLEGECHVEDAEALAALIAPGRIVDWTGCRRLHGAVLQVLLSFRIRPEGQPEDAFVSDWIAQALAPAN